MPTYEYECPKGHEFERILPVARYDEPQTCECGRVAQKLISRPALAWASREVNYDCPITGIPITSMAQHKDNLARHGCQQYDPLMKQDAERFRKREQEKLEQIVDNTVEAEISKMSSKQIEKLGNEFDSGVDISVDRI